MDIGNLIVGFSLLQAILLVGFLFLSKHLTFPKGPLIALLLALSYFQVEFLLVRNAISLDMKFLLLTRHAGWLLVGPLILTYIQSITKDVSNKALVIHLLPFILFTVLIPIFFTTTIPKRGIDYSMLTVFKYTDLGLTNMNILYGILFVAQFIHLGAYIGYSYWWIQRNPDTPSPFVLRSIRVIAFLYLMVLIFYGIFVTRFFYQREWDYLIILPFAVLVYFIVVVHLRHPEWFRTDIYMRKNGKYEKSELSESEINAVMQDLAEMIEDQEAYKQSTLSLDDVASRLGHSRHTLSQAINRSRNQTFLSYLNALRIKEAKELIQNNQGQSLLAVAHLSGFNNKATFNKYFKKETGQTPSDFLKSIESNGSASPPS